MLALKIRIFLLAAGLYFAADLKAQGISGFSPAALPAGTGAELTITGSGFGTGAPGAQRYVSFLAADAGGSATIQANLSDYVSWTDNQIVVKVPSGAGTGAVRVTSNAQTFVSSSSLTVSFNILNSSGSARRHIDHNSSGGYTFRYSEGFYKQAAARSLFTKSLKTWACVAGINWIVGEPVSTDISGKDGVNIVRFDSGAELPDGVLGAATTYSTSCASGNWEIAELDVVFNTETEWNFSDDLPKPTQMDFQSVALHELGHAHGLGHVIDAADMMHFAIGSGQTKRELSTGNRSAAVFQMNVSQTSPDGCSGPMVPRLPDNCGTPFPVISSFSPEEAGRDDKVSIHGKYLSGVTEVTFGRTPPLSFSIISDNLIEATLGTGFTGDVLVSSEGGTYALGGFTFLDDPELSAFSPRYGFAGDKITVTGNHLLTVKSISFGGVPAASFNVLSNQAVEAILGGGASGNIVVSTNRGSASIPGFAYGPKMVINSVEPMEGISGDVVTITGIAFDQVTSVKFGTVEAASFQIVSPTRITAVLGKGEAGDITLSSPIGTASLPGFIFTLPPEISSFSPGSAAGGAVVQIKGVHFNKATSVTFGETPAASFVVLDANTINAVLAEGSGGEVAVTTMAGTGKKSGFTFIETLRIAAFSPIIAAPGQIITITGNKFRNVVDISFGGVPARSFSVESSNTIKAVVGLGASGAITVKTAEGSVSASGFTFVLPPTLTFFSPTIAGEGTKITFNGSNLTHINSVTIGGVDAASFRSISDNSFEAILGKGASGKIRVSGPGGFAEMGQLTFVPPPIIDAVEPAIAGAGSVIRISGKNLTTVTAITAGSGPVASFHESGPEQISAVVSGGARGSAISLTTLGGQTVFSGFRIVETPLIDSFLPKAAVAGTEILISGTQLGDITSVFFGGVAATSFRIISAGQVAAIVPANAKSGSVSVSNVAGTVEVPGFSFQFSLPANNFKILVTDLTCIGAMNGRIDIAAELVRNYTASLSGSGVERSLTFSRELQISDLPAGTYTLCIGIDSEPNFKQCFELIVKQPGELALFSNLNNADRILDLQLSGGSVYFVDLNGKIMSNMSGNFRLAVNEGHNMLKIFTDKVCQGVIERSFTIGKGIRVFPNPFQSVLNISLPQDVSGIINYQILDAAGGSVASGEAQSYSSVLTIDVPELVRGSYILILSKGNWRETQRILRE